MASGPTAFADLNEILEALAARLRATLGGNLAGAYLQGSIVTGDFDARSDVDFVVIVEDQIAGDAAAALNRLHDELFALPSPWAQRLEGSYIPRRAFLEPPRRRQFLYLDNGSRVLVRSDHDDSLVVFWVLREHGVALAGPSPKTFVPTVSWPALCEEVRMTMRVWGNELLTPGRLASRWSQAFAVLSYCRMLHTLATGRIASKRVAAEWAEGALRERWRSLIRTALRRRDESPVETLVREKATPEELDETRAFIRLCIAESEKL